MKKALKHKCFKASCGGDKRDRTADLLNAIQALSRINGTPISTFVYKTRYRIRLNKEKR